MVMETFSSGFAYRPQSWNATPAGNNGIAVTPGASNAEGTYTQILSALAQDIFGLWLWCNSGATASQSKQHLLDIGVDPAGGSSYVAIISNIPMGGSAAYSVTDSGQQFFFPVFVKTGSTVAVRIQGSNATAGTVRVNLKGYGQPTASYALPVGQYSETIGTITNSSGVSFTPGNAADGTWVSLGTTTRALWWWQLGYQIDNGTVLGNFTYVELGIGTSGAQTVIQRLMNQSTTSETTSAFSSRLLWPECYWPTAPGETLWVRGRSNAAPETGWNALAVGIGG